jgi:hypothetical protein
VTRRPRDREQGGPRRILELATHNSTRPSRELDSMIVKVVLVPRLDCRYQSLSRRSTSSFASDFSRYSTALSTMVALTSTPTRTKPRRQLTWCHAASTNPSDTASGCRFSIRTPQARRKQWFGPAQHLRVPDLHAVPDPARIAAYATTRPSRRFMKRTSLSLNNPHARTRHPRAAEVQMMQAPERASR